MAQDRSNGAGGLPEGLHPDTLAVRESIPRSQYGEHSEALYLSLIHI